MKVQYLGPDDVVVIDGTELRQNGAAAELSQQQIDRLKADAHTVRETKPATTGEKG